MSPSDNIDTTTNITWDYSSSVDPDGDVITNVEWDNKQNLYTDVGMHTVKLRAQDSKGIWTDWTSISFQVTNNITYGTDDFMTLNDTLSKLKITQDSTLVSRLTTIKNANTSNTYPYLFNDSVNDAVAIGYTTGNLSNSYMYDKYNKTTQTYYIEKYSNSGAYYGGYYSQGAFYSFNELTGIYKSSGTYVNITKGASAYAVYNNGKLLKRLTCTNVTGGKYYYSWKEYVPALATRNIKGVFISQVVGQSSTYPLDGVFTDNYWYTRTTQIPYYNFYKYNIFNTLLSSYDVINKTLYSPKILMSTSSRYVKINLSVPDATPYTLYTSINNATWTPVNSSNLDGNSDIDLGSITNNFYWKIVFENDTSKINSIKIIN